MWLLAASNRSYYNAFVDYWSNVFKSQSAVVILALVVGAACIFIITRAKWNKGVF